MTRVRPEKAARSDTIDDKELIALIAYALSIPIEFYRLRLLAIITLLRLTGKRREEVVSVALADVQIDFKAEMVRVWFSIEKTRRKNRPRVPKDFKFSQPLIQFLLDWVGYLKHLESTTGAKFPWLFPASARPFGNRLIVKPNRHITGRQLYNVITDASDQVWPHLFRETAASDVFKTDNTLVGVFKVLDKLNLKNAATGLGYLRRHAGHLIETEIQIEVKKEDGGPQKK